MKVLRGLNLETMSTSELHDAVADFKDEPIVLLTDDDAVIPIGRVEWDNEMKAYVIRTSAEVTVVH